MTSDEEKRLFKTIGEIRDALLGTMQKRGALSKIEDHDIWIKKQKRSREGLANYAYKTVIVIVLGYIAMNIGLK